MPIYTSAEKTAINRAYDALDYIARTTDWMMATHLKEALKSEKKNCDSLTSAKAAIVEMFDEGLEHGNSRVSGKTAGELYSFRPGLITAYILGAAVADRWADHVKAMWPELARVCAGSHAAAMARYLDSLV